MTGDSWYRLRTDYADWLGRLPHLTALYGLAEPIISRLEEPRLDRPPLLDRRAAEAERPSTGCAVGRAVGLADSPIVYPFLSPPPPLLSEAEMIDAGWSEDVRREIRSLERQAGVASVRLKGYAGWLLTEPAFLEECRVLSEQWGALPNHDCPRFPLRCGDFHPELPEELRTTPRAPARRSGQPSSSSANAGAWRPWRPGNFQSPRAPCSRPPTAQTPTHPRQGLHLYLPIHYPLTGDDELLARILQEQPPWPTRSGSLARRLDCPITGRTPPSSKSSTGSGPSRVDSPKSRPRGYVGLIKEAIAETLEISLDQVKMAQGHLRLSQGSRRKVPALRIGI